MIDDAQKREIQVDDNSFQETIGLSKDFLDKITENIQMQLSQDFQLKDNFVTILETCEEIISDYSKSSKIFLIPSNNF